jgi:hypothetical protein
MAVLHIRYIVSRLPDDTSSASGSKAPHSLMRYFGLLHTKEDTMTDDEATMTITGKYVFLPNPCATEPCLPGMAYAVESSEQFFF